MTAPLGFPIGALAGITGKPTADIKKRVLLVDTCRTKRDIRAETMRRLGAEVDCAADIIEARGWWKPDLYDLVLLHVEDGFVHRDKFLDDVRRLRPQQQIAFLVGKPEYISHLPKTNGASAPDGEDAEDAVLPALPPNFSASADGRQRWGILEACRRISIVRSSADARTRALRNQPAPARDSETAALKRAQILEPLAGTNGKEV